MKTLQELLQSKEVIKEIETLPRHKLLNEFHKILNKNIERDNHEKIQAYKWEHQVSETEAKRKLVGGGVSADKRTYKPIEMRRLAVMLSHVKDEVELRDFFDMCRNSSNFNKCFFGRLKVKKELSTPPLK